MAKKSYPEEIYPGDMGILGDKAKCTPNILDIEYAYDLGKAHGKEQTDPLAGFSNLTKAIQDGISIDWEKLDKRVAKCVHPELGTLTHKMERSTICDVDSSSGWWWPYSFQRVWVEAFVHGWRGEKGWSLWIEGEIPLKRKTADTLLPGTIFKGQEKGIEPRIYVVVLSEDGGTQAIEKYSTRENIDELGSIDVLEVKSGGFVDEKE